MGLPVKNSPAKEGRFSTLYNDNLPAIKIWAKFFLRRFMRVYPPYAILLILIAYNQFLGDSYLQHLNTGNLVSHLTLSQGEFIFWSIPPEMKVNCLLINYYFL